MQLIPETAHRYGVANVFDPDQNIRGGVRYLADLLEMFSNDLPHTLAAYNAGENAVIRYGGIPPYEETSTYVKRAMTVYYGRPYGEATWFAGHRDGMKLRGGFTSQVAPLATPFHVPIAASCHLPITRSSGLETFLPKRLPRPKGRS